MEAETLTREQIETAVKEVAKNYPDILSVTLFGSYAKDKQTKDSDVDLILELEEDFDSDAYWVFWDKIEEQLKKKVDLHEKEGVDLSPFKEGIYKGGVKIYVK